MDITINGYSERGAMNALFYGIAYRKENDFNGEEAIRRLLWLADIEGEFESVSFYIECSLSGFGDPDLVIIANDKYGDKTCIFVEAKASGQGFYDVNVQKDHHDDYMKKSAKNESSKYDKGHSSNLFFQLRLKNLMFKSSKEDIQKGTELCSEHRSSNRKLGNNLVVNKLYEEIASCIDAKYVAIVPAKPTEDIDTKKDYGFDIKFVSWSDINEDPVLGKYIEDVIDFNKVKGKSQILNNK